LPDVRGTGETRAGDDRSRRGADTSRSATALMVGQPMLGARLRDVRSVVAWLRLQDEFGAKRIGLWGDSFQETFGAVKPEAFKVPRGVARSLPQPEPLGGLLAWFTKLYEEDVRTLVTQHGLHSFAPVLTDHQVYLPHDAVVPGLLAVVDVPGLVKALGPHPLMERGRPINCFGQLMKDKEYQPALWLLLGLRD
jgi:hypothetical protein